MLTWFICLPVIHICFYAGCYGTKSTRFINVPVQLALISELKTENCIYYVFFSPCRAKMLIIINFTTDS